MKESVDYGDLLRNKGLKSTKHRNSILNILESSEQPIAAEQVFLELKEEDIDINLSSVYRILDSLVSKGLVIKTNISPDSKALFELHRPEHRHYLICSSCKKMISVEGCPLSEYEKHICETTGFYATGHKLEIFGLCRDCRLEMQAEKKKG